MPVSRQTQDKIVSTLNEREFIRNVTVIAHVDHGKSTLTDSLVARAGLIDHKTAGQQRWTDVLAEEQERGITIKSTAVSLPFDVAAPTRSKHYNPNWPAAAPRDGDEAADSDSVVSPSDPPTSQSRGDSRGDSRPKMDRYLVNLIDSPGHVDFNSEVTAALRVSDGALVVVDAVEGVQVQTVTVLRQAIAERIKPVLFLNKLDRMFDLKDSHEQSYQRILRCIESVNAIIKTHHDDELGDQTVWPQAGTVGFGSGLHGWGFTLEDFAALYHDRFDMPKKKMMKKLWGDNFWDAHRKRWSTEAQTKKGRKLVRGFNHFVLRPLSQLYQVVYDGDKAKLATMVQGLKIKLLPEDQELPAKLLLRKLLRTWLPAWVPLLSLILRLPSPVTAQRYRVSNLYSGPLDDEAAVAIRNCDPEGPVMMYVAKLVPTGDNSRFYAFGRVYSGTLRPGQMIRIQGPGFNPGASASAALEGDSKTHHHQTRTAKQEQHLAVKKIQGVYLMLGPYAEALTSCPAGNMVGLAGVDQAILKTATLTSLSNAHNFMDVRHSVSAVVRVAVSVEPRYHSKLIKALERLIKSDCLAKCIISETGEQILCGSGELHIQFCLKQLEQVYLGGDVKLIVGDPVVPIRETITSASDSACASKSPNNLNRIHMMAQPLSQALCDDIDAADLNVSQPGSAALAKALVDKYNWSSSDAKKIWCFGLEEESRCNVLVDRTRGVQYLFDVRNSLVSSFVSTVQCGALVGEPIRGVRFDVVDAKIHGDPRHRSIGQIASATRRAMQGCELMSGPRLLEPMFLCEVTTSQRSLQAVYSTLREVRAEVQEAVGMGPSTTRLLAYVPVMTSMGFTERLRSTTAGEAFHQMSFSHWSQLSGDPLREGSLAHQQVMAVRLRKGMKQEVPLLSYFHDKL